MNDRERPVSPDEAEDSAPEHARRRIGFELPEGWPGVLLLLIVAALSGGLIASYWPSFFGGSDVGATQDRVAALESRVGQIAAGRAGAAASGMFDDLRRDLTSFGQRIDAMEARVAGLEKTPEGGVAISGDVAPLQQKLDAASTALGELTARVAKLEAGDGSTKLAALETEIAKSAQTLNATLSSIETRLKAVESNAPPPDLAQRLDSFALKSMEAGIETRVKLLEAQNSGESLHRAATMLALTQLAHAANETGSFTLQLDTYAATSPGDPMVELLKPYAKTGVPSRAALAARFPDAARAALDAERSADARSLFSRLWANVLSLVSVRRVGQVAGNDNESRLARAQAKLDAGDLSAAAAEVRVVQGVAAKPLASWLRDAFARMTLDRAVADMSARVIQALAASPPPTAPPAPAAGTTPPAQAPAPAQGGGP